MFSYIAFPRCAAQMGKVKSLFKILQSRGLSMGYIMWVTQHQVGKGCLWLGYTRCLWAFFSFPMKFSISVMGDGMEMRLTVWMGLKEDVRSIQMYYFLIPEHSGLMGLLLSVWLHSWEAPYKCFQVTSAGSAHSHQCVGRTSDVWVEIWEFLPTKIHDALIQAVN